MHVPGWTVHENSLEKEYSFPDFAQALAFVNRVGAVAEELQHHPDIQFTWGKVRLQITTHDAGRLTEKDFELAKAINGM
jgi:4a-hydroxytetrahydrobiopterin dehydratase